MPKENESIKKPLKGGVFGWKTGLEPATSGSTNQRSNQLSYNHRVGLQFAACLELVCKSKDCLPLEQDQGNLFVLKIQFLWILDASDWVGFSIFILASTPAKLISIARKGVSKACATPFPKDSAFDCLYLCFWTSLGSHFLTIPSLPNEQRTARIWCLQA